MSDGILRIVAGDEAALRIIVRQQRAEIDRLAAQVERLRITEDEHDALDEARRLGDQWGWSETIRLLQQRHARETVGG
jgi:hypothetical protein